MTSKIVTPPALAGYGARFGAALLDLTIFFVLLIPGIWIMLSSNSDMGKGFGIAFFVIGWIGLLITQIVCLIKRGQSLGKMAVGIKIVRVSDSSVPGFVKIVLLRMFVPSLLTVIPYAGALILFVDVLFIFRDDRRCLHDLIAETKVVDVQAEAPEESEFRQHQAPININTEQFITAQLHSVKEASTSDSGMVDSPLGSLISATVDEKRIYAAIAHELESGVADKGLWIRLFAECSGDEKRVKVLYVKERANHLIAAERVRLESEKLAYRNHQLEGIADLELVSAVRNGNWNMANNLLRNGIKPIGRDQDGNSLLDLAKMMRDQQMIQLLKSFDAP